MNVYLRDSIRFAVWGEDLVVLDTVEDAYALLANAGAGIRPTVTDGATWRILEPELLESLQEADYLSPAPPRRPWPRPPALPRVAGSDLPRLKLGLRDRLAVRFAFAAAYRDCQTFDALTLGEILALVRSRGRLPSAAIVHPTPRCLALTQAFLDLSPQLPGEGACLRRAFLLLRFLRACGEDADWVFGVRAWPFRAHCWLQAGEVALGERPDRLVTYAPILLA